MIQKIRAFFSAPVFEGDLEKTLKSRQLTNILKVLFVGTTIYNVLLPVFAGGIPPRIYLFIPLYFVYIGGFMLIRRGHARSAGLLLVLVIWLAITAEEIMQGGVNALAFAGNIIVVLTAAILNGMTSAIVFTVLTLIKGLILIVTKNMGLLPARVEYVTSDAILLFTQAFASVLAIALLRMATQNIRLSLERAHRELTDRRQMEKALQESEQNYRTLYETAHKQAQELALEGNVRTAMAQELDLPALLRNVVESIANSFGYTLVSLYLLEGDTLFLQHQVGYKTVIPSIKITDGVIGRSVRTGKAILLDDVRTEPTFLGAVEGLVSEICIPLFDEGHVVGALNVESTKDIKLNEADLKLLTGLGEHIGMAIKQARLYSNVQRRNRILSALGESTLVLMKQLDLDEVLRTIISQAGQILDTPHGYIYLVDPDRKTMRVTMVVGIHAEVLGKRMGPGEGLAGKVWDSGQPMYVPDYQAWSGRSRQFDDIPFHAVVGVPLTSRSQVVGVLGMSHLEPGRIFSEEDIDLLSQFAKLASIALENARLFTLGQQELGERKQVQEKLRESEERFRALIERSHDAITLLAADGTVLYDSPSIVRVLGYSPSERIGRKVFEFVPPEECEDMERGFAKFTQQTGAVGPSSIRFVRKDGSLCWIEGVRTNLLHEPYISAVVVNYRDITERKRAEESLLMFQYSTDQAMDAIFWIDRVGGFSYVNEQACSSLGYTREELMRLHLWDIDPIYPREQWDRNWEGYQVNRRGGGEHIETLHRRKDGSVFPVEVFSNHLWLGDRELHIAVVRDITERKRTEEEREKLITDLEGKNAELERFTYTVSHDLKSPLVTIRGFLGFLEMDSKSGNKKRFRTDLQRIIDATDKMNRQLGELVQLSRLGRLANMNEVIPFADLVHEALEVVHGQLKAAGVKVQLEADLPDVYGERLRLVEVLQNLIDNAAKYMGDQPDPMIEIGRRGDEDGKPVFYVRDNGIGIAPEYHEMIFGLFNKLDMNTEGTGMGLAIIKRIIEVHGGRIWLESEPGKGSTFYFTLAER